MNKQSNNSLLAILLFMVIALLCSFWVWNSTGKPEEVSAEPISRHYFRVADKPGVIAGVAPYI